MIGQQLGSYVIEQCIGDGGMGSVYLGVNEKSGERAAIKILRPELARNAEMVERILREGRAAGCIDHPGIVKILESGLTPKGRPFVIMEYLEGQSLSAYLDERRKLPLVEALRIGQELASALLAAHAKHVIHRDLKPDNVFRMTPVNVAEPPHVKILDFGIALMEEPGDGKRLTRAGTLLGTPCYMAPEVVLDPREASAASDAYSLGIILYQMLAGEVPFTAECPNAVLFKQVSEPPPALKERVPGLPPALCTLVQRLLSKQPTERPTMIETFWLLLGIERTLPPPSTLAQRVWRGNLVQRSVLWIAPSLFICALAAGITNHRGRSTLVVAPMPQLTASGTPAASAASSLGGPAALPMGAPTAPVDPRTAEAAEVESPPAARSANQIPPLRLATDAATRVSRSVTPPSEGAPIVLTMEQLLAVSPLVLAKEALQQKRYDRAITHARNATREHPSEAWKIIGRAGCWKKDVKVVKEALRRLDAPGQSLVSYDCFANHVDLRP